MKRTAASTSPGLALLIVALATTLPLTGCSFLFVQPAHEEYGYRGVTGCTTTPVAPLIDTIFTMTNLGSVAYVASENNVTNKGTAVTFGLTVGAIWLSSAIYGYYNTNHCSELQTDSDDEHPYRGPVRGSGSGWRAPVAPRPAPPPPAPPAAATQGASPLPDDAAAPAQAVPPQVPVVPQQPDDDDPGRPRKGPYPLQRRLPE